MHVSVCVCAREIESPGDVWWRAEEGRSQFWLNPVLFLRSSEYHTGYSIMCTLNIRAWVIFKLSKLSQHTHPIRIHLQCESLFEYGSQIIWFCDFIQLINVKKKEIPFVIGVTLTQRWSLPYVIGFDNSQILFISPELFPNLILSIFLWMM